MKKIFVTVLLVVAVTTAYAKPPPKSIETLRTAERDIRLNVVGEVEGGLGFSATLVQYESAGLKVHAMVATPLASRPEGGWPVVIANHGHHPVPRKYGITAEGKNHRPGDYYRRIPELFVAEGYLVVLPDYRGHNSSEGIEFTEGMLESAYYTEDVLNLLSAVGQIDGANAEQVFMWGHSMGGEVTLRALLASENVRAASMWSSVGGDIWGQAFFYSRNADAESPDSSEIEKSAISELRGRIAKLDGDFDTESVEPYRYLDDLATPIIIQHSQGDRGAAYKWSERLAKELYVRGKIYEFWTMAGDKHLFAADDMRTAVLRDVEFFARFMP